MTPQHFCINGREHEDVPYHYRECGLDNIYLLNGFTREIYDGEEYISVENVDNLWKAIGLHLVLRQKELEPNEIRFLRQHMNMTQADLARRVRVTDQTIARWEKGKVEIPGPADLAIRILYLASPAAGAEGREILNSNLETILSNLVEQDETRDTTAYFTQQDHDWREQIAVAA